MAAERDSRIPEILRKHESELLTEWVRQQQESAGRRRDMMSDTELQVQSREFLGLLRGAAESGTFGDAARAPEWAAVRDMLAGI